MPLLLNNFPHHSSIICPPCHFSSSSRLLLIPYSCSLPLILFITHPPHSSSSSLILLTSFVPLNTGAFERTQREKLLPALLLPRWPPAFMRFWFLKALCGAASSVAFKEPGCFISRRHEQLPPSSFQCRSLMFLWCFTLLWCFISISQCRRCIKVKHCWIEKCLIFI